MSARFVLNFLVLLLGAGVIVVVFAFSGETAGWTTVGAGATAIVLALTNFALAHQGSYQRVADVAICAVGAWAIVAARVLTASGRWLDFAAGAGLAALGAAGLVVREIQLARGVQIGEARIGADEFAHLSTLQREAGVRS